VINGTREVEKELNRKGRQERKGGDKPQKDLTPGPSPKRRGEDYD